MFDFPRPPWPISNSYVRFDVRDRAMQMLRLPAHVSLGECTFVPKSSGAREGEGYLIGVGDDLVANRSMLIVANAQKLEDGPVAIAKLPMRAGPQVHGCWVPAGAMALPELD
jgi:carotenoid cleavage dioxygenase-like enzyme